MRKIANLIVLVSFLLTACLVHSAQRTLLVGITDTPPLVYEERGKVLGFFIDILEHVAEKEDWKLIYKCAPLNECIDLLKQGKLDIIADIGYSDERDKFMDFNRENVLITWGAFYTQHGNNIIDYNDLNDKRIAVENGDYFVFDEFLGLEKTLNSLSIKYELMNFETYAEVLNAVKEGKADVGVVNKIFGKYTSSVHKLAQSDLIFLPVSLRYGFSEGTDSSLMKTIDTYLIQLKNDKHSIYYKSLAKYVEKPKSVVPIWLLILISSLIAVLLYFIVYYNLKVRTNAKELEEVNADHTYTKLVMLRMNQTMYEVLETLPIGIFCINDHNLIEFSNKMADEILFDGGKNHMKGNIHFKDAQGTTFPMNKFFEKLKTSSCSIPPQQFTMTNLDTVKDLVVSGIECYDPVQKKKHGLFAVEDITEIKKLESEKRDMEESLMQMQRIESLGRLVGGIAHDFNNLLTIIKTSSDLAMLKLGEGDVKIEKQIDSILTASEIASNLTDQLLIFSRKHAYMREPVDLKKTISEFLETMRRVIGRNIEIEINTTAEVPSVMCDRNSFLLIVMNLVLNARDSIGEKNGKIRFSFSSRKILEEYVAVSGNAKAGEYACFSVSDNGGGIENNDYKKLFEPFYTTKEAGKGTGLGLSVVKGIVLKESGFIDVENIKEGGAVFTVCFPLSKEEYDERKGNNTHTTMKAHVPGFNLLLVEHDIPLASAVTASLSVVGYNVFNADSIEDARRTFDEHRDEIKGLITDVNLPDGKGYELAEILSKFNPNILMVFTSAYIKTEEDNVELNRNRSAVYLQKPYSIAQIIEALKTLALK